MHVKKKTNGMYHQAITKRLRGIIMAISLQKKINMIKEVIL